MKCHRQAFKLGPFPCQRGNWVSSFSRPAQPGQFPSASQNNQIFLPRPTRSILPQFCPDSPSRPGPGRARRYLIVSPCLPSGSFQGQILDPPEELPKGPGGGQMVRRGARGPPERYAAPAMGRSRRLHQMTNKIICVYYMDILCVHYFECKFIVFVFRSQSVFTPSDIKRVQFLGCQFIIWIFCKPFTF